MDKTRRKELVEMYKNRCPERGIIAYRCRENSEMFLGISKDTKADFNSNNFKLSANLHRNKRLQELWNHYGKEGFEQSVVKVLEYDNPQDDHSEELEELLEECIIEEPNAVRI